MVRWPRRRARSRPTPLAAAAVLRLKDGADGEEESVALVPLSRSEAQPRVLEGKLRDLPPGRYAVELVIPDLADKLKAPPGRTASRQELRATFSVTPPDGEEMVELATNWPLLEELAAKSGGKVFAPEDAGRAGGAPDQRAVTREEHAENRLWQWWATLAVVLPLLTRRMGRPQAGGAAVTRTAAALTAGGGR